MLSRIAKTPLKIPADVKVTINANIVRVDGPLGYLEYNFNKVVSIGQNDDILAVTVNESTKFAKAMSGTAHALLNNMLIGVTKGFEKRLLINGVGYKASMQGGDLHLTLGYSHPIIHKAVFGIKLATPSATEISVTGINKELVGTVADVIRAYRSVEPYKGKGIRYADEVVILKETSKKKS